MLNAIVSAKNQDTCDAITLLLSECGFNNIKTVLTGAEVRKQYEITDFDLAVICTPLEDEFGLDLVSHIYKNSESAVVVLANSDVADEIQKKVAFANAFVLSRPLNKLVFLQCIKYVMLSREEILRLKSENTELQQKMRDLKLIDRAKCMLIQYLRISETQAHRHIQKQAMDQRITQTAVAMDILKTYEN
ncbi:MAG TPA: ANTAR domain-containing protein [Oscillospiraceae bacterium]|nr:ANTAR domain-containing protein [Oscillospiraceae bacterium]